MSQCSSNSTLRKIRENFSRQVRKSQIQKIQKQKRQKQLKSLLPISYITKVKKEIISENVSMQKIMEAIHFLSQNIKNQQFAQTVQNEKLIEVVILKTIQAIQPWIQKRVNNQYLYDTNDNKYCIFPAKCQCLDCSENSTSISESYEAPFSNEDIEFDNKREIQNDGFYDQSKNYMSIQNTQEEGHLLLSNLLDFLYLTFDMISCQISNKCTKTSNSLMVYGNRPLPKSFMFRSLFMQTPQILQGLLLDLINYKKNILFQETIERQVSNISQRYPLIFKIVYLLSKFVQISCFDEDQWRFILQVYINFSQQLPTQVKNQYPCVKQMKEVLILLSKSYMSKDIFSNTKFTNQINKIILPWLKSIKEFVSLQTNKKNGRKAVFPETFTTEFEYTLKILQDLKFLEKNVNQEIKLILGEILNISTSLEKPQDGEDLKYFYISPKILSQGDCEIQNKCRSYSQKLIQILYLQMELTEDDFHTIINIQPSMKIPIQKIIDSDIY